MKNRIERCKIKVQQKWGLLDVRDFKHLKTTKIFSEIFRNSLLVTNNNLKNLRGCLQFYNVFNFYSCTSKFYDLLKYKSDNYWVLGVERPRSPKNSSNCYPFLNNVDLLLTVRKIRLVQLIETDCFMTFKCETLVIIGLYCTLDQN
ncbi:hypothetical protein EGR_06027 [Echinococcus granulosus]|uniref:Uncharacterized protein n=1 Tax=Echinococcus granulosus TaxID=6210 RepID=W6UZT1_ECHGR|nr:hypothetical protein EGR_06027 [Echinococcus granulosus]EUB59164.1 hypothetical protein EGR_06027 [Echinococcus granulosus]